MTNTIKFQLVTKDLNKFVEKTLSVNTPVGTQIFRDPSKLETTFVSYVAENFTPIAKLTVSWTGKTSRLGVMNDVTATRLENIRSIEKELEKESLSLIEDLYAIHRLGKVTTRQSKEKKRNGKKR